MANKIDREVETIQRPPLPPFNHETALAKVKAAEDAWNSRNPKRVAQAYTADSSWRNRARCNDFAIGIELEGTDDQPYTDRQYSTLAKITFALFEMYPRLSPDAIVGHQEIAPERKTDPGAAFDWPRYLLTIAGSA